MLLSVIIPACNEEKMIRKTAETISAILNRESISYELLFVDDGSEDATWQEIRVLSDGSDNIHGISFSRNFGKEAAIFAGIEKAKGDCAVVIDCDLQHPPEAIVEMYRLWEQGYEIIEARKNTRGKEGVLHRAASRKFYSIISRAVGQDMSDASDFKLMDRKVLITLLNMPERNTFFRALSSWVGYKTTIVYVDIAERTEGETKWSTWKLIKYAINNITSFTTSPMQIVTAIGGIMLIVDIVFGAIALTQKIMGVAIGGFTTVILLLLLIGSLILISLGIIGFYVSKIYEEIKGRPRYLIREETENKE